MPVKHTHQKSSVLAKTKPGETSGKNEYICNTTLLTQNWQLEPKAKAKRQKTHYIPKRPK